MHVGGKDTNVANTESRAIDGPDLHETERPELGVVNLVCSIRSLESLKCLEDRRGVGLDCLVKLGGTSRPIPPATVARALECVHDVDAHVVQLVAVNAVFPQGALCVGGTVRDARYVQKQDVSRNAKNNMMRVTPFRNAKACRMCVYAQDNISMPRAEG
jgi:hypothetical protein